MSRACAWTGAAPAAIARTPSCTSTRARCKPLTAREAPRLLAWQARYPFNRDGGLDPTRPPFAVVTAPDGRAYRWGDPRLRSALAADLGREIDLRRDIAGIQDLERSLLVTTQATLDGLGDELAGPIDLRRFRPNLHLRSGRSRLGRARLGRPRDARSPAA